MTIEGRLDVRIFAGILLVVLGGLAAVSFRHYRQENFYIKKLAEDTQTLTETAAADFKRAWEQGNQAEIRNICEKWQQRIKGEVKIIDSQGRWWGLTVTEYSKTPKPLNPEVTSALKGLSAAGWGDDPHSGQPAVWAAVKFSDNPPAVIQITSPLSGLLLNRQELSGFLWLFGAIGLMLAGGIAVLITRRVRLPARQIALSLARLADGDFYSPISVENSLELDTLSRSVKSAQKSLRKKFKQINYEKSNLDAILSGMSEGIIAIGRNEQVWRLNQAAAEMLEIEETDHTEYWKIVRNSEICELIRDLLADPRECERELVIYQPGERFLNLKAAPVRGRTKITGIVIVLNDITRLKKLDLVRREFVANVSHELKTPLTAVKGALETLREGAVSDPEAAGNFLNMSLRHTDRLADIVDDLLILSRLESDGFHLELKPLSLAEEISESILQLAAKASEKSIEFRFDPPGKPITVAGNRPLLQTVFLNLLDNAVKYSEPGGSVSCSLQRQDKTAVITIEDQGVGIPPQAVSRVFERFYRVDSSRSRELGGTGLGLSIVKHVLEAHQGSISLESQLGEGSAFIIRLPIIQGYSSLLK